MFEVLLPDEFSDADDATVVAAIEEYARAEAAVGARRLQAIAELAYRRVVQDDEERVYWACDFWDAAAAEVGAAMGIGHRAASREMQIGLALRDRLPKVAALYREGRLSSRLVSAITWRSHLVDDDKALRLIDDALAERATAWGPLSASGSTVTTRPRCGIPAIPPAVATCRSAHPTTSRAPPRCGAGCSPPMPRC